MFISLASRPQRGFRHWAPVVMRPPKVPRQLVELIDVNSSIILRFFVPPQPCQHLPLILQRRRFVHVGFKKPKMLVLPGSFRSRHPRFALVRRFHLILQVSQVVEYEDGNLEGGLMDDLLGHRIGRVKAPYVCDHLLEGIGNIKPPFPALWMLLPPREELLPGHPQALTTLPARLRRRQLFVPLGREEAAPSAERPPRHVAPQHRPQRRRRQGRRAPAPPRPPG